MSISSVDRFDVDRVFYIVRGKKISKFRTIGKERERKRERERERMRESERGEEIARDKIARESSRHERVSVTWRVVCDVISFIS